MPYTRGMSKHPIKGKSPAHLGVAPSDRGLVAQAPAAGRGARKPRKISDVFGVLQQKNGPRLTIEDLNEATARGWAGEM